MPPLFAAYLRLRTIVTPAPSGASAEDHPPSPRRPRRLVLHPSHTRAIASTATGSPKTIPSIQWPAWAKTSMPAFYPYVRTADSNHSPRLVKPTMTTSIQYCERMASRGLG